MIDNKIYRSIVKNLTEKIKNFTISYPFFRRFLASTYLERVLFRGGIRSDRYHHLDLIRRLTIGGWSLKFRGELLELWLWLWLGLRRPIDFAVLLRFLRYGGVQHRHGFGSRRTLQAEPWPGETDHHLLLDLQIIIMIWSAVIDLLDHHVVFQLLFLGNDFPGKSEAAEKRGRGFVLGLMIMMGFVLDFRHGWERKKEDGMRGFEESLYDLPVIITYVLLSLWRLAKINK